MNDWWQRNIIEPGKLPLLLFAVAFVVTFLATRTITRMIRAGRGPFKNNVTESGLHIHHSVPGIILLVVGAMMAIGLPPDSPWREIAGVLAGVGASLVLDEFAMILHLDDVYWTQEGEASVQAVALTAMCMLAMLLGLSPFGVNDVGGEEAGTRWVGIATVVLVVIAVVVCAMKGKYRLALLAIFVPFVAIAGAIRLARPDSRWFDRRYKDKPGKQERATKRAERFDAHTHPVFRWLGDVIAGSPNPTPPTKSAAGKPTGKATH